MPTLNKDSCRQSDLLLVSSNDINWVRLIAQLNKRQIAVKLDKPLGFTAECRTITNEYYLPTLEKLQIEIPSKDQ